MSDYSSIRISNSTKLLLNKLRENTPTESYDGVIHRIAQEKIKGDD